MAPTMVALILEVQKKPAEAQKIYEKIVAATPTAAVAANNLAWLYAENGGNLDVAMQLAQSASQQLPKVPQVTDTLGWVYLKKDLASLAIPPLLSSIENDPEERFLSLPSGPRLRQDRRQGEGEGCNSIRRCSCSLA